jgi:hypothetical protein
MTFWNALRYLLLDYYSNAVYLLFTFLLPLLPCFSIESKVCRSARTVDAYTDC